MFKFAIHEEPLINELICCNLEKTEDVKGIPKNLQKNNFALIPNLDETQVVRHFHRLSQMNFGIDTGMYPLGSCTMKYNPKICEEIAGWDNFSYVHPYQDISTVQGNLEIMS